MADLFLAGAAQGCEDWNIRGTFEDEVGEPACVCVLLPDPAAGLDHRRQDELGGEGAVLVGDVGAGLQPRFMAIPGVDEVHGFTLTRGREELSVA